MMKYEVHINDEVRVVEAEPDMPLLWVIRDVIGLTGTKFGCGRGLCGACTVHLNDVPIRSCVTPIKSLEGGGRITTIEGLGKDVGEMVQAAWIEHQVPQCGYCQSGQIMTAVSLLNANSSPTVDEIDSHMQGNLCRCGTYNRIRAAVQTAAKNLRAAQT